MRRPETRFEIDRDTVVEAMRRARELRAEWLARTARRLMAALRERLRPRRQLPAAGARAGA